MDDGRQCLQCGGPMDNRRSDAVFCRQKCRRRYSRRAESSNYAPPPSGTSGVLAQSRADETFRRQFANEGIRAMPLTDEERDLLARQRRNPGPLLPELRDKLLEHELERMRREAAEYSQFQPLKPENPFDPSSQASLARRAIASRNANRRYAADPNMHVLRPSQSGPDPLDDLSECIDAPWARGRGSRRGRAPGRVHHGQTDIMEHADHGTVRARE